ncbi:hypothetical protein [Afipia felis]|uniref:Uncharacterized protein n=2 Tax=Afipia felis TaxID=1035 RepID=A0A380W4I7_AFIFE|nr:hypothetical protein [Afipia felis]EKS31073.1 hypothetical protein HMPREF9697_03601 [Afipia felis ATCC 53690]SUU75817.1 Uncharacterised protein [Afipia felis]SUU83884.1 Uncharacterised protein [Afipia felis]
MSKVPSDRERLSKISKAIDDSILDVSEKDLREEFAQDGDDFDKAVTRVDSAIERAKFRAARVKFDRAKSEAKAYREGGNITPLDLDKARRRLDEMRTGDLTDTMMAARKGGKLSDRDEAGIVDDLARLQALEDEAEEKGEE